VWDLIVKNDDICFTHILPRLNRTDLKFLGGVNSETRKWPYKERTRTARTNVYNTFSTITVLSHPIGVTKTEYCTPLHRRSFKHISKSKLVMHYIRVTFFFLALYKNFTFSARANITFKCELRAIESSPKNQKKINARRCRPIRLRFDRFPVKCIL